MSGKTRGLEERGERWVYGSDELYLLAGVRCPAPEFYGDFAQVENGVGAVDRAARCVSLTVSSRCRASKARRSAS